MSSAAGFLGGASGRLLPASVPFRFFGTAVAYHVLAWAVLVATAGSWVNFRGGLGMPLAALHLFTLGVLGMTALGAGAQLVPVATRQSPVGARWLTAVWWVYTPGVALLAFGMAGGSPGALNAGGGAVAVALGAWVVLMARHLLGGRGMPGVRAHVWVALACLGLTLVTGAGLATWWAGEATLPRGLLMHTHVVVAPFGFMGLLTAGISSILVPIFVLGPAPRERSQLASLGLLVMAIGFACVANHGGGPAPAAVAWLAAACGIAWHLHQMRRAMQGGMRKELGLSFALVRFGWGALVLAIACAGAGWAGLFADAGRWTVATALAWLTSVLFGFLQRILPFLGALHAAARQRRGPTISSLTHARALRVHAACHLVAWCAVGVALSVDSQFTAAFAGLAGLAGSLAFAWFHLCLVRRMRVPTPVRAQVQPAVPGTLRPNEFTRRTP